MCSRRLSPSGTGLAIEPRVSLRPAVPADADWLTDLRIRTMGPHLEASGEVLSESDQRARVLHDFDCIRVVELGGQAIGMRKVVKGSDPWRLVQVQLVPEHQGRGIGGAILSGLLDDARREGVAVVLSVLKVNPARRLYDRLGFRIVAENERSYEMRADARGR